MQNRYNFGSFYGWETSFTVYPKDLRFYAPKFHVRLSKLADIYRTAMLQQVAKIVETLHLLGALLISLLSLTLQAPSPLISVTSETKKCWELKQSTLKGGEGRGSGKGLNSTYAEYWKLEKVFFNESVSTILQLVV